MLISHTPSAILCNQLNAVTYTSGLLRTWLFFTISFLTRCSSHSIWERMVFSSCSVSFGTESVSSFGTAVTCREKANEINLDRYGYCAMIKASSQWVSEVISSTFLSKVQRDVQLSHENINARPFNIETRLWKATFRFYFFTLKNKTAEDHILKITPSIDELGDTSSI